MKKTKRQKRTRVTNKFGISVTDFLLPGLQLLGRLAIPLDQIIKIIGSGKKQLRAYNLCDGTKQQLDIAKESKIAPGNFNNTLDRWVENGIIFLVGNSARKRPLHVYPVPENLQRNTKK